jgi:hypothetical protein
VRVIDKRTVGAPAARRQLAHLLAPAFLARLDLAWSHRRAQHRAHRLLQIAQGQRADAVFAVDYLTLLGHSHHPGDRATGR